MDCPRHPGVPLQVTLSGWEADDVTEACSACLREMWLVDQGYEDDAA